LVAAIGKESITGIVLDAS